MLKLSKLPVLFFFTFNILSANISAYANSAVAYANTNTINYILENFKVPEVAEKINNTSKIEFEQTNQIIKLKKSLSYSSNNQKNLKSAEIKALELIEARSCELDFPEFVFSKNIIDGYTVKTKNNEIKIKHVLAKNVKSVAGNGIIIYKNAYKASDVLYAFGNSSCEEMILLKNNKAPTRFEYDFGKSSVSVNVKGELVVDGLIFTRPIIIDSEGKKINGMYEVKNKRAILGFSNKDLKYPLLVDPTWVATNSMANATNYRTLTLLPSGKVLVAGGYNGTSALSACELYNPLYGTFSSTGSMATARQLHTATLLPTGKVLITGGGSATCELYDPDSGTFSNTAALPSDRSYHSATLLLNGKVLVTGNNSCVLYNPTTGTFSSTGSMKVTARSRHTATLLPNGKVLMAAGYSGSAINTAELYDPDSGAFDYTGSLGTARERHTATLLPNGKVFIAGGQSITQCELYNPDTGTFSNTAVLSWGCRNATATLLPNGKVLIAGGFNGNIFTSVCEVYDPASGTRTRVDNMINYRCYHSAILLDNGKVLITGGQGSGGYQNSCELYNPSLGTFSSASNDMGTVRNFPTATLLPNGKVLIAGGYSGSTNLTSCLIFDPAGSGTFSSTGNLITGRYQHTATLLPNGKVLIAGGYGSGTTILSSCELYDPSEGTFSSIGSLNTERRYHTATLLPNGKVLMAGGTTTTDGYTDTCELYSPSIGTFAYTSNNMPTGRSYHAAVLLTNGKVLIAGGYDGGDLATCLLYDPTADTFTSTGSLSETRSHYAATLLQNGRVLLSGGFRAAGGVYINTWDLYDPTSGANGQVIATGNMTSERRAHRAILLPNGKVLLAGGSTSIGPTVLSSTELYDPGLGSNGTCIASSNMTSARDYHTMTLLPNGRVLIAAGGYTNTAETARYTEYDYTTYSSVMQPLISTLEGSSSFPIKLTRNRPFTIGGSRFKGCGEASSSFNHSNSATNYPRIYLRKIGDYADARIIDLTALQYPMNDWSATDTAVTFNMPGDMEEGHYLLSVNASAVPSDSQIVYFREIPTSSSYTTMSGSAENWEWNTAGTGDTVRSGSPQAWTWRTWDPESGRKVPQGNAQDWSWEYE
ncbi:MAG: kelch repeat-containing protein [Elusimicrobiota bacterium]